ncbi:MAG: autotransporter-associated beta strand repeat-containing protein [bacterium]|nr:autotransporter-associated beta strand repeat-containing protein [bacterium]
MRKLFGLSVMGAMSVFAADYTWLANPASGDWLTGVNWSAGGAETVWTAGSSDTATFGASATTDITVDGTVALKKMTVNGEGYVFTNGTLALDGEFNVAAGKTATVSSRLLQEATSTRFAKTGTGTLVIKGDSAHTNAFFRFADRGGSLVLDGGEYRVTGAASGAKETEVAVSLANSSSLTLQGGANFVLDVSSTYLSNSGCDMLVTNATFNCFGMNEFLHGFQDNNADGSARSTLTIADGGTVIAKQFRIAKLFTTSTKTDYGRTYLKKGGTFVLHNFSMDSGTTYKARMDFDGGYLVPTNNPGENTQSTINMTGRTGAWPNVELFIQEGGFWLRPQAKGYWYYYAPFLSGCAKDGGVHIVDSANCTSYFYGTNSTYNGGFWLHGAAVAVNNDRSFGAVPAEPTNSIFALSGSRFNSLHFSDTFATAPTRQFYISTNADFRVGAAAGKTGRIRGTIFGEPDSIFMSAPDWTGTVAFDPGEGKTNTLGKLYVAGNLVLASGTTLVTSNSVGNAQDAKEAFYVNGGASSFAGTKGRLIFAGGNLKTVHDHYLNVEGYGEVIITNGHLDASVSREWLNGLATPGRTFVGGNGMLSVQRLRISQVSTRDANGDPVTGVTLSTGGVIRTRQVRIDQNQANRRGYFAFDGGTLQAVEGAYSEFIGLAKTTSYAERWTNQQIRVCSGGAIIDTDRYNVNVYHPLWSWAEHDGGLTKKGTGQLTIANEADWPDFTAVNTYNGPTRIERGTLKFTRAEGGFPGGDLEILGPALTNTAPPSVILPKLVFREGHGIRIADADKLDDRTFGKAKTFATVSTPLTAVPSVEFVAEDGTILGTANGWKGWHVKLSADGKSLTLGPVRGTICIFR